MMMTGAALRSVTPFLFCRLGGLAPFLMGAVTRQMAGQFQTNEFPCC